MNENRRSISRKSTISRLTIRRAFTISCPRSNLPSPRWRSSQSMRICGTRRRSFVPAKARSWSVMLRPCPSTTGLCRSTVITHELTAMSQFHVDACCSPARWHVRSFACLLDRWNNVNVDSWNVRLTGRIFVSLALKSKCFHH